MFERHVQRTDAVDVRDDNGAVRRGVIRDCDDSGNPIIDFDYPGHHRDLILLERCVFHKEEKKKGDWLGQHEVETLFRRSADQPWRWYPSTVLSGTYIHKYRFVEVHIDGGSDQYVVAQKRIRTANLPIEPEKRKLQKFSSPLPNDPDLLAIVNGKAFFEVWNAKTRTIAVGVEGNTLVYLAFAVQPKAMRRETFLKHLTDVRKILENGRSSTEGKDEQNDLSSVTTKPAMSINTYLYPEILMRIFSFLELKDQINSRQVCASWNAILKSSQVLSQVQIDLRDGRAQELVAAMEKLISASTKTLVIRRAGFTRAGFSGPFSHLPCRVVMTLLKARKIRLPTVIVADTTVVLNDLRFFHPTALRFGWEEICDRLVMENITLSLSFETRNYRDEGDLLRPETGTHCVWETRAKDVCIKLRVDHAVVAMKAECRMETVLQWLEEAEKIPAAKTTRGSWCAVSEDQQKSIQRALQMDHGEHNRTVRYGVVEILNNWEVGNSGCRARLHADDIDFATLDLQSLNKLTIYALFHFFGAEINTW